MTLEERIDYLVELGENMIPVNLGSLINTFNDCKNYCKACDYATSIGNRNTTIVIAPYVFDNMENVVRFQVVDINNEYSEHAVSNDDPVLIVRVLDGNKDGRDRFVNKYYYDHVGDEKFETEINKEYKE